MAEELSEVVADVDISRRFGGVARLYGADAAARYAASHVCVVGVGGVGSWVAEALARSAVGAVTLIDLDMVAESNTNRQIHALDPQWGHAKVDAMAARISAINPLCQVRTIDDFVTEESVADMLSGHDVVVDAIDQVRVKVAMAAWAVQQGVPFVMCGGAGGKQDPSKIACDDLARTTQDPLLSKVRAQLRKHHGFTRDPKKRFGVEAIYSTEPIQQPVACDVPDPVMQDDGVPYGPQGLSCAGYGSGVCVTASFGFMAAARALKMLSKPTR